MTGLLATHRTTQTDLDWWFEKAARLEWTWAKTYAESAPHDYVVLGRSKGMSAEDFVRAGRVIRTFGVPGKFWSYTNIYLTSPDGRLKWWTMDAVADDTDLINRATTDRTYGPQEVHRLLPAPSPSGTRCRLSGTGCGTRAATRR